MGVTVRGWGADAVPLASSTGLPVHGRELNRTFTLIRGTNHRFSLFEVQAQGVNSADLTKILQAQFDREAQADAVGDFNDTGVAWLLFVRSDGGDRVLEARVHATLHAALAGMVTPSPYKTVRKMQITATHRDARSAVDFDELVDELRAAGRGTPAGIFH